MVNEVKDKNKAVGHCIPKTEEREAVNSILSKVRISECSDHTSSFQLLKLPYT